MLATLLACSGGQKPGSAGALSPGGSDSRIEERSLSDRPPLSVIERQGDPESAIAFASLSASAPDVHAALGEALSRRLVRAGLDVQLVSHGLGFELVVLADGPERARHALQALLGALTQPMSVSDVGAPGPAPATTRAEPSVVAACSGELELRRRVSDPSELERERRATFARDRAALGVVGSSAVAAAVASALSAGPDWPELGRVPSILPARSQIQVLSGDSPSLSLGLALSDPNRALGAAARLGDAEGALGVRLSALGYGLRLRHVAATAHPLGACLRIDSDVDASPPPEARRLGFAVALMLDEASRALEQRFDDDRLERSAVSAPDPRSAARAAAYRALLDPTAKVPSARLVTLTTPAEGVSVPSLASAIEQAQADAPPLDAQLKVEAGQPGTWALVSVPCATSNERADAAGISAVLMGAAAAKSGSARLEPFVGAAGVGLLGFAERAPGETDAETAARLGDALGRALVAPPDAVAIASARGELIKAAGSDPKPLLDGLLDALSPGHFGALSPRGSVLSLQSASRETVLTRQRELLRLPHRLAVLSPTSTADAAVLGRSLSRWLKTPDPVQPSPCDSEANSPVRGELRLALGAEVGEGSYVAFRVPAKAAAEASSLVELLNLPGGPLTRALTDPDLVGAARAQLFGTPSARALVVQVSAFSGREQEALSRVQRLFERLASGGVLSASDIEQALARQRSARRLAALDPRFRLLQLLEPGVAASGDAQALRRLVGLLRPETAVIARSAPR